MGALSAKAFNYVQQFACLAERCEDTCCKGWPIAVSERDHGLFNQALPVYENLIVKDSAGGYQMNQKSDGHCVAFDGGRCKVHAQLGEQALSSTCANFPRMFRLINGSLIKAASMGCPEITRQCLFGADPFRLDERRQDGRHLGETRDQAFAGLVESDWSTVVGAFLHLALAPEYSADQSLLRLYDMACRLDPLPHSRWAELLPLLVADYRPHAAQGDPPRVDPLLIVLMEVLKAPNVPPALSQRLFDMLAVEAGDSPQQGRLQLLPAYRDLYAGEVRETLDRVLKRFMAAEMTRTGFPFLSSTRAGQDYGLDLVEWGATLAVRTLALRYLLLAHCNPETRQAPARATLVELVYRYCRAANHNPATAAERVLRQSISDTGATFLGTLLVQVGR